MDPSSIPGGSGGYELHQKLRTKIVRLLRKKKYEEAIETLYSGSMQLLDMKEEGSACDLAEYLLDVYTQADVSVTDESRDRITNILGKTTSPMWRKKTIAAAIKWSTAKAKHPLGDEKLRIFLADLLRKDKQYFDAEAQFIAACAFSSAPAKAFAEMLLQWNAEYAEALAETDPNRPSKDSVERVLTGTFALRGWIPLLLVNAPKSADEFLKAYVRGVTLRHSTLLLPVKPNPREYKSPAKASTYETSIYLTASPALNFSQNVIALVMDADGKKPVPDEMKVAWQILMRQFLQEGALNGMESALELLSQISTRYFDLEPPRRQMDMISSMFSSMMGSGGANEAADAKTAVSIKQLPRPAEPEKMKKEQASASSAPAASEADELVDDEMD